MHRLAEAMVPSLIPNPGPEDQENMRLYYGFYLKHKEQLQNEMLEELNKHPFWSELIKNIPKEVQEEQGKISEEAQKKAIFDNDWTPYVRNLVHQGVDYAAMGISFTTWFELINMHRKNLTLLLIQEKEKESIQIINGLNTFVDIAMSITGEAYITEKKSIVERQKKEQEILNKELEQFLYIATHDLKEPLNTVNGYVELFRKKYAGKFDQTADTYLTYIHNSVNLMKELVKDLMDYSIIGNEKNTEKTDLNDLVRNIITGLQSSIENKQAEIEVGDLPTLYVHPREMGVLFQNLISNAIKFSRDGVSPKINVSSEQKNGHWQFSVKDNGLGIDKKFYEKIFVIFQRLNPRSKYEGTGIGLAHCKKIVELHKGEIWVESIPGEGSEFYFTIQEKKKV
jgi:signal transduction histidine kinase